ncbi:MAG: hypothetical protein JSV62_01005 [Promethearchaeota archaeon]|nr:MAG: hypothetical protein JSV62_01005 [Candidatus Lokiarchaeota archaeon]
MENSIKIEEQLEKIVFDKDNLKTLKEALMMAKTGEISITNLGKKVLELRSDILNALLDFIPFHIEQANKNKSIREFTKENSDLDQLEKEIKEKNQLLEVIGKRINKIYKNLENDMKSSI